jgi:nucleotide-binding universal stress UspA family protein
VEPRCGFVRAVHPSPATERTGEQMKMLVGFSSTRQGDDAVALAGVLGELLHARPTILRVIPVSPYLLGDHPEKIAERESRLDLDIALERLADLAPTTRAACDHSVARALTEVAEEEGSSLIVVGSTHRGRIGRLLPGTTASRLLQGAPAAVAVAPPGYSEHRSAEVTRIGVGVDGSPEALTALAGAVALGRASGAELHLMAAGDPNPYGYGDTLEVLTAGDYESLATQHAREALADAAALVPDDLPLHKHLIHDDPGGRLADQSRHLDLLLLGSRGYGPVRRTLLGTVAGFVINHASCPVIVTPRGVGADAFTAANVRAEAAA